MKTRAFAALTIGSILFASPVLADDKISVEVTNLTYGFHFTPLLIAAHDRDAYLFHGAETASANLQAMAEGGDISGLASFASGAGAVVVENPAGGLLAPGATSAPAQLRVKKHGQGYLSVVAMLLPTNDGFVGLDSWPIPDKKGTYTVDLVAWDAGTEANDEHIVGMSGGAPGIPGIPAAPGGNGGINASGVPTAAEGFVHVHRGPLGDTVQNGGESDLDSRIHRWQNPVAQLTVTVR